MKAYEICLYSFKLLPVYLYKKEGTGLAFSIKSSAGRLPVQYSVKAELHFLAAGG